MNRAIQFLTVLLVMSALHSCAKADAEFHDPAMFPGNIRGIVTDEDGNPLNHIKVIIDPTGYPIVEYTSSKGEFVAYKKLQVGVFSILLEDIDGQENGGEFAPLSDMITVLEDQEMINLEYRMTRATSSESSQRL